MSEKIHKKSRWLIIPHLKMLSGLLLMSAISWGAWLLVILKLDPFYPIAQIFFYLSLFFALLGSFTILLFSLKRWHLDDKVYLKHLTISLRQGLLLSLCTCACLGLLSLGLLRIWNGLLLVVLMTLFEFYLSTRDDLAR